MLTTIRRLRADAAQALADTVAGLPIENTDERQVRDAWHTNLCGDERTLGEGWYIPPPHGLIVAIGNPPDFARVKAPSYRPEQWWPSPRHRTTSESVIFAYASRVDRATGLIGDIACSLYRGNDPRITSHLQRGWDITMSIAHAARPGMSFSQLYQRARSTIERHGLANDIYSVSDAATNIGHTLPWSDLPPSDSERAVLASGDATQVADLISSRRRFVSAAEEFVIGDDLAFTIEPRLSAPGLPAVVFHTVVVFVGGTRTIVTEFAPLFELFGMTVHSADPN